MTEGKTRREFFGSLKAMAVGAVAANVYGAVNDAKKEEGHPPQHQPQPSHPQPPRQPQQNWQEREQQRHSEQAVTPVEKIKIRAFQGATLGVIVRKGVQRIFGGPQEPVLTVPDYDGTDPANPHYRRRLDRINRENERWGRD